MFHPDVSYAVSSGRLGRTWRCQARAEYGPGIEPITSVSAIVGNIHSLYMMVVCRLKCIFLRNWN